MTTRTGTTRKAPWAVFLTALLAALALVLGSLVIAVPANAKDNPKPDNPGNSVTAPGHQDDGAPGNSDKDPEFVPPGQQTSPDGSKKVWICHADTNKGQGQLDLGVNGTGGEYGIGFNLIEVSWSAWVNAHHKLHPHDVLAGSNGSSYFCPGQAVKNSKPLCVTLTGTDAYATTTFWGYGDSVTPVWTTGADGSGTPFSAYTADPTEAKCATVPVNETESKEVCAVLATGGDYTTVKFTGTKGADITTWKSDPGLVPYTAYLVDLTGANCLTPDEAAALDAAVAAAVPLPATAAPAPATVKVPAKGPIVPATVPAGDGSTAPTAPLAALTFAVLAATALAASTVRLVGAKR